MPDDVTNGLRAIASALERDAPPIDESEYGATGLERAARLNPDGRPRWVRPAVAAAAVFLVVAGVAALVRARDPDGQDQAGSGAGATAPITTTPVERDVAAVFPASGTVIDIGSQRDPPNVLDAYLISRLSGPAAAPDWETYELGSITMIDATRAIGSFTIVGGSRDTSGLAELVRSGAAGDEPRWYVVSAVTEGVALVNVEVDGRIVRGAVQAGADETTLDVTGVDARTGDVYAQSNSGSVPIVTSPSADGVFSFDVRGSTLAEAVVRITSREEAGTLVFVEVVVTSGDEPISTSYQDLVQQLPATSVDDTVPDRT